jgi:hypothetical protein
MEEVRNAYRLLVRKPLREGNSEDLDVNNVKSVRCGNRAEGCGLD